MSVPQQLSSFNNQIPPRYAIKSIKNTYRISGADYGQILNCSGTTTSYTISTAPAASVGAGFNCWVWNIGGTSITFVITIDPNGSETIDGNATLILRPGEGTQIVSDGLNWQTVAKKTMRYYSENSSTNQVAAASNLDAIAVGRLATASGQVSAAFGSYNSTSSGNYSTAIGYYASATGDNSMSFNAFGNAIEINKYGYGGGAGNAGVQTGLLMLCQVTTDATPTILTSNFGVAGSTNQLVLQNATAFAFSILAVARQKSANGVYLFLLALVALLRSKQSQFHVLPALLLLHPSQHLPVDLTPSVLLVSLLNLQQLPVTPKHAVKLFHFLLRNDVVVIAADEQHCYRPGDTFEVSHVVFVEEGETEAILDLLFEKVEQEGDEGLRKAAFPVDHPPDHLLQRPDGTIEDQLAYAKQVEMAAANV
jgi:hypothetical protein